MDADKTKELLSSSLTLKNFLDNTGFDPSSLKEDILISEFLIELKANALSARDAIAFEHYYKGINSANPNMCQVLDFNSKKINTPE